MTVELLVVAVPGGSVRNGTVLSAVLVPRLSGGPDDADLSFYGLADWPDVLRRSTITVTAGDTRVAGTVRSAADSDVWRALFGAAGVRPFAGHGEYPDPRVEPSATHQRTVERLYASAGRRPGDPAHVGSQLAAVPPATLPPVAPPVDLGDPAPEHPDFHRLVTFFREHPAVMRALGLIVDIDITDPAPLTEIGTGVIAVNLTPPAGLDATVITPVTHFNHDGHRFTPLPRVGSPIAAGLLDLSGPAWSVATFDVAATLDRLRLAKAGAGAPATLPAIRSTGLSVLHLDRERHLRAHNRAGRQNAANRGDAMDLFADNLVLGYRLDVRTSDTDWASLCRRQVRYDTVTGGHAVYDGEEEGHVKTQGATYRGADRTGGLRADETVVRWDGWSPVCPHPGQEQEPGRTGTWLSWRFTPLSVPSLRFGETYRIRARVADLAGNGLHPDDPGQTEAASDEKFYGRHDPVVPPEMPAPPGLVDADDTVHPGALGPGGLIDVLVIRSDPGDPAGLVDVAAYAAAHPYPANDARMLLPPPAPFMLCDQARALDPAPGEVPLDDATFAALMARSTLPPAYTVDGQYSWLPDPHAEGVMLAARPGPRYGTPPLPEPTREGWAVPTGRWPDFAPKQVQLTDRAHGQNVVDWLDGHRAVVRLTAAETLTVEISSSVTGIEPFAMTNWLQHGLGLAAGDPDGPDALGDLTAAVRSGRHPLVSPPRVVRFVHAVQRPVNPPAGTLAAHRTDGDTFALLADVRPVDNPWFGLDPASTAQLDIVATWSEVDPMAGDATPAPRTQDVGAFALDATATALPPLRHEFGDTRHRRVTYRLTAQSRFRQFFEGTADVTRDGMFTVSVPNTAAPAPPVVPAVVPALGWTTEAAGGRYTRTRRAGLVRVELDRPWNLTGEGEDLGVVVEATRLRRDPIRATTDPGPVTAAMFPLATGVLSVTPSGADAPVTVARHAPFYDASSGRWCADVEIGPVVGYAPFVELSLVRVQAASLPGKECSAVVRADALTLLPARTLTVWRDGGGIRVRLDGDGPGGRRPNVVRAAVETLAADLDPDAVELAALGPQPPDIAAWRTAATADGALGVDLDPVAVPPGPDSHVRIVVTEIEPFDGATAGLGERVVFLDVVRLTVLG